MDDDELIEQLLVRIACIFEDASALLLLKHETSLAERVATARVAVDRAAAIAGAAVTIQAMSGSGLDGS